jgi:hypothetical protein
MVDASLVGEMTMPAGRDSLGSEYFDLNIAAIRPKERDGGLPQPEELGYSRLGGDVERSTAPTHAFKSGKESTNSTTRTLASTQQVRAVELNESTVLPSSPAKYSHLLASTNALNRIEPPWASESSSSSSNSTLGASVAAPVPATRKPSYKFGSSPNLSNETPSAVPTIAVASSKSKRTFPASSFSSLASVGEEHEDKPHPDYDHFFSADGDKSTLFPVSPAKMRHLLRDEEMLTHETFLEEPSYLAPAPRRLPSPAKSTAMPLSRSTVQGSPQKVRRSPIKDSLSDRTMARENGMGDVTLDVGEMMARMNKPKRASGTEESFVDLLHGGDVMEDMEE